MKKKNYILDTSVYLTNARAIYDFGKNDIIIPLKVLEEVDKHKKRQDGVGAQARQFIRILDALREKGSLKKGVRIETGKGIVKVCDTSAINTSLLPSDLNPRIPDHIIIATALTVAEEHSDRKNIMVSRDINMRVICDAIGLVAQDYNATKAVDDLEKLYSGFETYLVDDQTIDRFYAGEDVFVDEDEVKFHPNQYLLLVSNASDKKNCFS